MTSLTRRIKRTIFSSAVQIQDDITDQIKHDDYEDNILGDIIYRVQNFVEDCHFFFDKGTSFMYLLV